MTITKFVELLDSVPRPVVVTVTLGLIAVIGGLDYATSWEYSFGIFYLLPIGVAALGAGRRAGLAIAVVSAIVWFVAEKTTNPHYTSAVAPYWNALARLGSFALFAVMAIGLKEAWQREKELADMIRRVHDDATVPVQGPHTTPGTGSGAADDSANRRRSN